MKRTGVVFSFLDTLSRHEEDCDKKQEQECVYVTIQQAARRCGVSDKTIQRAIRAGTLPAHYPQPDRCEIAVSDLNTFMSEHVQRDMEQRVAELEQRVQQLEHQAEELLSRQERPKPPRQVKPRERTTGPLPKQFVSLLAFARLHNIAESMGQTHMGMGLLPIKRGTWADTEGGEVILALDVSGRIAFSQLYCHFPQFLKCSHCYLDSVPGQEKTGMP